MTIAEAVDPTTALTAPHSDADANFATELRTNCGLLLGGLDWLIEQIFDYSPLQEWVIKPFAGDWVQLRQAQGGWANAALASQAVGDNFVALVGQTTESWQGESGDAFRARMTSLGDGFGEYAHGCTQLGEVAGGLINVAKSTASVISIAVGFIGQQLERLAVEMAVPVVGWIAGGFDLAAHAAPMLDRARKIFEALKKLVTALKDVIEAVRTIAIVLGVVKNMLNTMGAGYDFANAGASDDAAANNFGTT